MTRINAGNNLNLTAAQIQNAGTGATVLTAGNNLNLNTVAVGSSQDINWDSKNYLRQSSTQDVGTQITGAGRVNLSAGQDINAQAATIDAGKALSLSAGNDIQISAGQGIIGRIARRGIESSERLRKHRWVVERTRSWFAGVGKLRIRFERQPDIHEALLKLSAAIICARLVDRWCYPFIMKLSN